MILAEWFTFVQHGLLYVQERVWKRRGAEPAVNSRDSAFLNNKPDLFTLNRCLTLKNTANAKDHLPLGSQTGRFQGRISSLWAYYWCSVTGVGWVETKQVSVNKELSKCFVERKTPSAH